MSVPAPFPSPTFQHTDSQAQSMPFTASPTRHLLYHIWPNKSNDNWIWNIEHLLQYIDQFNGVRSIAVVVDQNTYTLQDVKDKFNGVRISNWLSATNIEHLRECLTFVPLMRTLPKGPNDITFYAHAKGVRHNGGNNTPVIWAHVMYRALLEFPHIIDHQLQQYGVTGCFKRYNDFQLAHHECWHYSGTFFWFRNNVVFNRSGWDDIAQNFFAGVEAWPSRIFKRSEGGVVFGDDAGNLYQLDDWHRMRQSLREFGIEIALE